MKKIDLYKINLLYVLVLAIVFFTLSENGSMVSLCFLATNLIIVTSFMRFFISKCKSRTLLFIIIILCIILSFSHVALLAPSTVTNEYYTKVVLFSISLMNGFYFLNSRINQSNLTFIFISHIVVSFFYLIFYNKGFSVFEGELLLTLNFSNPNTTGAFIVNTILYLLIFILSHGLNNKFLSFFIKFLCGCLVIGLFMLLQLTGCRSALLALIFFIIACFIDVCISDKIFKKKSVLLLFSIWAFVFAMVYLSLKGDFNIGDFANETAGKTSATRLRVWTDAIECINNNIFCGDYNKVFQNPLKQMHNTHLDIFASYGLIPFLLFIVYLYKLLRKSASHTTNLMSRSALYAFMSCLILGIFEAGLVSGSTGLQVYTYGFLLIINFTSEEKLLNKK